MHLLPVRELRRVEVEPRARGRHARQHDACRSGARPPAPARRSRGVPTASIATSAPSSVSAASTSAGASSGATACVAPTASAAARRAGGRVDRRRSVAAPAMRAPWTANCPTPPAPTTTTAPPGCTRAARSTAPTPVRAAQPSSAACVERQRRRGSGSAARSRHQRRGARARRRPSCGTRSRRRARAAWCRRAACPRRCRRAAARRPSGGPRRHGPHAPQAGAHETTTRSPGRRSATPSPTASTTPAPSWPRIIGTGRVHSPRTTCRSEPHTPDGGHAHEHVAGAGLLDLDLGQLEGRPGARKSAARVLTGCRAALRPAPAGHRRLQGRFGARLRVCKREARAPLHVCRKRRAELRIRGHARLVRGGQDHLHPARPPLLADRKPEVLPDHVRVPAVLVGVERRPAEDLGQPGRDVLRMVLVHAGEHRPEDRVVAHAPVEHGGQPLERLRTTGPLVQRGHRIARLLRHPPSSATTSSTVLTSPRFVTAYSTAAFCQSSLIVDVRRTPAPSRSRGRRRSGSSTPTDMFVQAPRDDHRLRAEAAQLDVERRAEEGADALLVDHDVAVLRLEAGDGLGAPGAPASSRSTSRVPVPQPGVLLRVGVVVGPAPTEAKWCTWMTAHAASSARPRRAARTFATTFCDSAWAGEPQSGERALGADHVVLQVEDQERRCPSDQAAIGVFRLADVCGRRSPATFVGCGARSTTCVM